MTHAALVFSCQSQIIRRRFTYSHEYGLPREAEQDLETLTRQKGFVPNPKGISDLRLDMALASQLEKLISGMPGVVDVSAVVRSHLGTEAESSPSASVVVRYVSSSGKLPVSNKEIEKLIQNSLPGIGTEQIHLTMSRVFLAAPTLGVSGDEEGRLVALTTLAPFVFRVPEEEREAARRQVGGVLIVTVLCSLFVGLFSGWRMKRRKTPKKSSASSGLDASFFVEGESGEGPRRIQAPKQ